MSIPDTFQIGKGEATKLPNDPKPPKKWLEIVIILLLILVSAVGGYGVGKISKIEETKIPIAVVYSNATSTPTIAGSQTVPARVKGKFVASRGGTAYYFPWCSGADRIAEKNKIWFESEEEAQRFGYKLAKGCK